MLLMVVKLHGDFAHYNWRMYCYAGPSDTPEMYPRAH